MAKLVTVVQTFFNNGTYCNNTIEMDIPNKAAELIEKEWKKKHVGNCVSSKFLALNQSGCCYLKADDGTTLCGINGMCTEDQVDDKFCLDEDDEEE